MSIDNSKLTSGIFDRAAIMRDAWKQYRYVHRSYALWQIERGILDGSFANALRIAWRLAKQERRAKAVAAVHGERIAELRAEIDLLSYKPARIDITPMRRAFEAQIAALAA